MQKILILGAGLSSTALIKYLQDHSVQFGWKIRLADASLELALRKIGKNPNSEAIKFDAHDEIQRNY
jgi:saccharopine dehydrogenase-like NADP-dependent oxidoreductase